MNKASKSKKRGICFDDFPIVIKKKGLKTKRYDPGKRLRNPKFVAEAFFQALSENDVDAALDTLEGYLMATGKATLSKEGNIAPSTVYNALSEGANPTLKTVARLLHAVAA